MATSILGRSLADPQFEPLYADLDRREALLYIHPAGVSACSPLIADYGLTWPIGAPIEDTISATQLIFKGIPARYPRIKIINSHLGGALPMLLQRLDNQYRWAAPEITEPPSAQARRMWYDTVGHFHVPALRLRVFRRRSPGTRHRLSISIRGQIQALGVLYPGCRASSI